MRAAPAARARWLAVGVAIPAALAIRLHNALHYPADWGFDASFNGWGKEDSDLVVRLLNAGVRRKDGTFATGVMHLWHPDADRSQLPSNERRLADAVASRRVRAERGLTSLAQ